jgi:hypothetical protein
MTDRVTPRRRGSYGIDAPYAPAFILFLLLGEIALGILSRKVMPFLAAAFIAAILATYLHGTLRGKFVIWAELLDRLQLRGDERILDMGCGRGAVLLMAAQHLSTGRAVGVDVARTRLGWRFWWAGPWAATSLITALKPERRTPDGTAE